MPKRRRIKSRMLSEKSSASTSTTAVTAKSGLEKESSEKVTALATASIPGVGPAIKNKGKRFTGKIQKEPEQKEDNTRRMYAIGTAKLVHKTNDYYIYEFYNLDTKTEIRFKLPLFYKRDGILRALAHTKLTMLITFEPQHKPQEIV